MPRRGNLGGHRVVIASLFLPDTLSFIEPGYESALAESPEESTAPPSPDSLASDAPLPIHELSSRLAASMSMSSQDRQSRSMPVPARTPKNRQPSFTDTKINMSELMYEAAAIPKLDVRDGAISGASSPLTHSRRGSTSEHTATAGATEASDIPVAPASDHGRAAMTPDPGASSSFSTSPLPGQTAPTAITSNAPKSRRSSFNTNTSSGTALAPAANIPEGSGTRTPGARAGGKLGITTPLSIISDLAARRGGPIPTLAATADSERHHPFGSGAVTPMAGTQTPGNANRPPGLARAFPSSLSMTRANPSGTVSAGPGQLPTLKSLAASKSTAGPSGSKTPGVPSALQSSKTASAVASGSTNDHGRGVAPLSASSQVRKASTPTGERPSSRELLGRARTPRERSVTSSPTASVKGRLHHISGAVGSSNNQGPPAAPSSVFSRNRSFRSATRRGSGRRTSSTSRSQLGRRTSTASLDTVADDDDVALPPFEFVSNPSANGGLINAVKSIERERLRAGKLYVGTPAMSTEGWLGPNEKRQLEQKYLKERSSMPVWLDDDDFDLSYNRFCKQILWPTFHYTSPTSKGLDNEHEAFRAYWEVNRRFADAIEDVYQEGDIVWINDYHLLLVAQMVRERLPHATIGLFVHIAFPSSEIFRCLSMRETLLRGMLGADLIGFQTHNFCRHFRQTVSRILQLEATPKGVQLEGSFVTVAPFPIGIDVRSLNAKRQDPEVSEWVAQLRQKYAGKRIIVGRDKLDWIKGVRQKLLAFEAFLDENPKWAGEVVLIQVALATTEENEEIGEATDVVSRINNKYSSLTYQPVVFLHVQDITFSQYLALLTVADCFLATSLREGMNLTSHEFVVCQEVSHRPLILSEFTGTYSGLRACIGINPWNTKQVAHAIHKALTMDESEMVQRWTDLHRVVVTQTAQQWITSLLGHLERAHLEQERLENMFVPRLEVAQLVSEWRAAHSRLLLIDLEETLVTYRPVLAHDEGGFRPPEWLFKLLNDLAADSKNVVYILSGMGTDDLDRIASRIDSVGFVAEDGCFVKHAGENHWNSLVAPFDLKPVRDILSYFTERTPNSYIEERSASMCWRFWNDTMGDRNTHEAQWARRQSAEVANLIHERFSHSLRVVPCRTNCLILPRHASRVAAVQHIIMQMSIVGPFPTAGQNNSSGQHSSTSTPSLSSQKPTDDTRRLADQPPLESAYKQPSNYWPMPQPTAHSTRASSPVVHHHSPMRSHAGSVSHHLPHHFHQRHTFDFVLALSQDEKLLSYVNTLDLFAPVTCTTVDLDKNRGTEAAYFLAQEDVQEALEEMVGFRARDLKWANR
ncbi:related to alpha,alpha-trehalose-phosphate synthase, 115 KD subunit [Melanopsichium pennsylvanicum]|uniref:Related to alpha,alpha-trehalose-phosphate synthase, 115 KD subunit n=2 Tax=Melanopsichium pennsylvanicum TaxID=63383 RepID=A0AAJ5C301_9BASI|nr:related to alpha,alpha-trehalose-phosphate synthase, 115 KD subunit [Melanopsichium pennsylvanicum 4]SNX82048.1 related to alpha,alpha-trehalose-phosphate synthase, 115 KD subunit [Melanopsichium pennsylvanicum]